MPKAERSNPLQHTLGKSIVCFWLRASRLRLLLVEQAVAPRGDVSKCVPTAAAVQGCTYPHVASVLGGPTRSVASLFLCLIFAACLQTSCVVGVLYFSVEAMPHGVC